MKIPITALQYAVAALILLTGSYALAQTSGSVSIVSDYRFRGVSLSKGHPEPQANLEYDSTRGWYVGAFASSVDLDEDHHNGAAQLMAYGGYSRPWRSGLSWEAGATQSLFLSAASYNYAEVFAGLASDNFSGRVYFSPNYFGQNNRSVYLEFNGSYPIPVRERFHLLGHIGISRSNSVIEAMATSSALRFDTWIGVSAGLADWNFQGVWVATERKDKSFSSYGDRNPRTWILKVSYMF